MAGQENNRLDVSVLIATRDRANLLSATLEHIQKQVLSNARWEVIVVDNGSSDETRSLLLKAKADLPLVVLSEPRPGKNQALNMGLGAAQGQLLVFTDDDVVPQRDWLSELLAASRRWTDSAIFGGPIIPLFPHGTPVWLTEHAFGGWAFTRFLLDAPEGPMPANFIPFGPNFAIRSTALKGIRFSVNIGPQGKDYPMGGETELIRRLLAKGEHCVYVPSAKVKHVISKHQVELEWLMGRSFRAGRGQVRLAPRSDVKRFFGSPRFLWRMLLSRWWNYLLAKRLDERSRFDAGISFYEIRGQIHEHRRLSREFRSNAQPPKE